MSLVLDNSVALAWCFEDKQSPAVMELLDRVAETGAVTTLLWPLEASNGLQAAERRRRLDAHRRATLIAFLRELPISLDAHTAEQAWGTTAALAERRRLTLYDAAYLELAQRRRLPLATLDRELADAATAEGVAVLGT